MSIGIQARRSSQDAAVYVVYIITKRGGEELSGEAPPDPRGVLYGRFVESLPAYVTMEASVTVSKLSTKIWMVTLVG